MPDDALRHKRKLLSAGLTEFQNRKGGGGVPAYTAEQVVNLARRGKANPGSLTPDEVRAICLLLSQAGTGMPSGAPSGEGNVS